MKTKLGLALLALALVHSHAAETKQLFTGRIEAVLTRGGEAQNLLLTAGTNCLRVERTGSDRPWARNLIDRDTGEVTLLFPHNRSYTRLPKAGTERSAGDPSAAALPMPPQNFPAPAGGPPALPPPSAAAHIGPTNLPGMPTIPTPPAMPQMPAMGGGMPMMPPMAMMQEPLELKLVDGTTNLLGFTCRHYELKQRAEVMEIWAVETNLPFAPWMQNQPPRFGPRMIEEQWGKLVAEKKLFPVLAVLKFENGPERMRYELKSVTPQKPDAMPADLFVPSAEYQPVDPLPF